MSTIINATTTNGVVIQPDNSGSLVLQTNSGTTALTISTAQNATFAGTVTLPTGTLYPIVSGTTVASTSGTSIDFTSIPSWVKRITVMFNGVSTNGTSNPQIQIGSGSVSTTGYTGVSAYAGGSNLSGGSAYTTGFGIPSGATASLIYGHFVLTLLSSNTWVASGVTSINVSGVYYAMFPTGTSPALSGALDRVRITTVNGTDAFDAGSINILYE